MKRILAVKILIVFFLSCHSPPPVKKIHKSSTLKTRTLFIAVDGIDYELMRELKDEGYYKDFASPIPLLSTFPSDTTVGFTGILQPLGIGQVPGYEVRFYSYKENEVKGGTLLDFYKIPIKYKYFFDSFRHHIHEKAIMYMFPGLAGRVDLINAEKTLYETDKKILMTYLGGTDGSSHILGRGRTKRFLKFMDEFLTRMKSRYEKHTGETLRIVLFSDHGFHHENQKSINLGKMKSMFEKNGFRLSKKLENPNDVVTIPYGLLSAGTFYTAIENAEAVAKLIIQNKGVDLAFWHNGSKKEIFIINQKKQLAKFEYRSPRRYRYVEITGDPLNYGEMFVRFGIPKRSWLSDKEWFHISYDHEYPDAGFRLYDGFFNLVRNSATVMFSTEKDYSFGSLTASIATIARFGHKGTHGGLFRSTTWGLFMKNWGDDKEQPEALRYNRMFHYVLPKISKWYETHFSKMPREIPFIMREHLEETNHH